MSRIEVQKELQKTREEMIDVVTVTSKAMFI